MPVSESWDLSYVTDDVVRDSQHMAWVGSAAKGEKEKIVSSLQHGTEQCNEDRADADGT